MDQIWLCTDGEHISEPAAVFAIRDLPSNTTGRDEAWDAAEQWGFAFTFQIIFKTGQTASVNIHMLSPAKG